jgi:hypothetical protein
MLEWSSNGRAHMPEDLIPPSKPSKKVKKKSA